MNTTVFRITLLFSLFVYGNSAFALDMQEGLWKTQIKVEIPNGRMPFKFSSEKCLSPKDPIPNSNEKADCITQDIKIKDNTVSWTLLCTGDKGTMTGTGEIIYKGEDFSGKMDIAIVEKSRSATLIYRMNGKRLGNCSDDSIKEKR